MLATRLFEGPRAVEDLSQLVQSTGLKPMTYCEQFLTQCGLTARGGTAMELRVQFLTFELLSCHDRLNVTELVFAEHLCRRLL